MEALLASLPGFEIREGQLSMLRDVQSAYDDQKTILIEAGTGIGKSFAYLIPALLWAKEKGEPTVIATHTIALQEQLIQKDLPFLLKSLNLNLKAVLVKGMHNYVCLRKIADHGHELPQAILNWAESAQEGSKSELPAQPSHDLWEQISAEAESCTHIKCPHYKECFFFKARKQAADADILVANHHLLFADLSLREEKDNYDEACILPAYRNLILDEAHHVEDVATEYFSRKVSKKGIIHLLGRLLSDRMTGKFPSLHKKIFEVIPPMGYDAALAPIMDLLELSLPVGKRELIEELQSLFEKIALFLKEHANEEKLRLRKTHLEHPFWEHEIKPAIKIFYENGKRFIQSALLLETNISRQQNPLLTAKCEGILAEINGLCQRLDGALESLLEWGVSPLQRESVRWADETLTLVSADLDIAPRLSESLFERIPTIVLCSATLSTKDDFSFIRKRLGILEAEERVYASPFNYEKQALLAIPLDLPDPSHAQFVSQASEKIWQTLEMSEGGAFVLFTSYAMLKECQRLLGARLAEKKYTLFCQGEESRTVLLKKFRVAKRAVLFGTDSFWEGVDVVGDALRCVIIVKLPFKVPSDPLFQARCEAITDAGGSPFFEYSLPHAIVKFKQGFGRLIRNKDDRGCVVCLDPRLVKKGYGKFFIRALPLCQHSNQLESVDRFFRNSSYVGVD